MFPYNVFYKIFFDFSEKITWDIKFLHQITSLFDTIQEDKSTITKSWAGKSFKSLSEINADNAMSSKIRSLHEVYCEINNNK